MDSVMTKMLYTNAFNDIEYARNCQISISHKEMEIQMININLNYSSYDNTYLGNIKKQSLEFEINNLKNNRDNYVNRAISNALSIAEKEINDNITISVATIVVSSITSFISTIQENFNISITNRSNLSLLSARLMISGFSMYQLKRAIDELKSVCRVI